MCERIRSHFFIPVVPIKNVKIWKMCDEAFFCYLLLIPLPFPADNNRILFFFSLFLISVHYLFSLVFFTFCSYFFKLFFFLSYDISYFYKLLSISAQKQPPNQITRQTNQTDRRKQKPNKAKQKHHDNDKNK